MSNTNKQKGRPKGSFSFVTVSMTDLAKVVGPNGHVTVATKFAKDLGLQAVTGKASVIHGKSAGTEGSVEVRTVTSTVAATAPAVDTTPAAVV